MRPFSTLPLKFLDEPALKVLDQYVIEDEMGVLNHTIVAGADVDRVIDEMKGASPVESEQANRLGVAAIRIFDGAQDIRRVPRGGDCDQDVARPDEVDQLLSEHVLVAVIVGQRR